MILHLKRTESFTKDISEVDLGKSWLTESHGSFCLQSSRSERGTATELMTLAYLKRRTEITGVSTLQAQVLWLRLYDCSNAESAHFIVTGTPGAGKTSVGKALLQQYEFGIHIPIDDLREWVVSGIAHLLPAWTDETTRQFWLVVDSSGLRLEETVDELLGRIRVR